jgi:anaerobic C4-dicarboxylate transporter
LEFEIKQRYGHPDMHPAMRTKYELDMTTVVDLRVILAKAATTVAIQPGGDTVSEAQIFQNGMPEGWRPQ